MKIDEIREEIDKIDNNIMKLLDMRIEYSQKVGTLKKLNKIEIKDNKREKEIYEKIKEKTLNNQLISEIYTSILKTSRDIQE